MQESPATLEQVIEACAEGFGVPVGALKGGLHNEKVRQARAAAVVIVSARPWLHLSELAPLVGRSRRTLFVIRAKALKDERLLKCIQEIGARGRFAMKTDLVNQFVVSQIVRHRVQKWITVAELAQGTDVPLGSLSCLLTGHYRCSLENLFRLLSHLGVSIREVWPEFDPVGITPQVNERIIQVAIEEAESRLPQPVTLDAILDAVCEVYGLKPARLSTPSRRRDLSEARAIAAHLTREQPHLWLVRLSEKLRRDVSSLFHVVRRMEERLSYDRHLRERLEAVLKLLS